MGFKCSRLGYSVSVDGLQLGRSTFVIQAAIEFDAALSAAERERLAPMAQLEALLAIEGQEERARLLGARDVHVGVVGAEPLRRLFRTRAPVRTPAPPRQLAAS